MDELYSGPADERYCLYCRGRRTLGGEGWSYPAQECPFCHGTGMNDFDVRAWQRSAKRDAEKLAAQQREEEDEQVKVSE
jgi:hypothetical protein